MQLFLFRHGIANPPDLGQTDGERPLTETGKKVLAAGCHQLAHAKIALGSIVHSPFLRAQESAAIIESILGGKMHETGQLLRPPGLDLLETIQRAYLSTARTPGTSAVAVVGHQPYISELAALLTIGDGSLGAHLEFRPGTVAHLQGDPSPGAMYLRGFHQMQFLTQISESVL